MINWIKQRWDDFLMFITGFKATKEWVDKEVTNDNETRDTKW